MLIFVTAELSIATSTVAGTCATGRPALRVEYTVEDGMNAQILRGIGAPAGVRGIEREEIIVQGNYRWQRTLARWWQPNDELIDAQLKKMVEQAEAGIAPRGLLEWHYRVVAEDVIEVRAPRWAYRYNQQTRKGSKQTWPEGHPRVAFASAGANGMLIGLARPIAQNIQLKTMGHKTIAGYACESTHVEQPFKGEICTARIGNQQVVLHQAFEQGIGMEYVTTAVQVTPDVCVGPEQFAIPTDVDFSGGGAE